MKKLFTIAFVLLVSFVGYSQVKVATMQKAGTMDDVNTNVQSLPNMVRLHFGKGELDYTTNDWQTNWGNINRTIVWPDGKVSFAYNIATDESFSDRGTGIIVTSSTSSPRVPTTSCIITA